MIRSRLRHRHLVTAVIFGCGLLIFASGSCSQATAGRDANSGIKAEIQGVKNDIGKIALNVGNLKQDMKAGRDVSNNDAWTMRLLAGGSALNYVVGKIIWIMAGHLHRTVRKKKERPAC